MKRAKVLTTEEAGRLLGVSSAAVRLYRRQGRLPGAYRDPEDGQWRIPLASVKAFKRRPAGRPPKRQ